MLTRRMLMRRIDAERIERAIADAERATTGEICVSVAPYFWGDVTRTAERAFTRLGMDRTRERNGVLFFIVPSRRRFVILGDRGIHERAHQKFWDELAEVLGPEFHQGRYTEGLVQAIARVGERLAELFPAAEGENPNELPNRVDFG